MYFYLKNHENVGNSLFNEKKKPNAVTEFLALLGARVSKEKKTDLKKNKKTAENMLPQTT